MAPVIPYAEALACRDPIAAVAETTNGQAITSTFSAEDFERSYAKRQGERPQILTQLEQSTGVRRPRPRLSPPTPPLAAPSPAIRCLDASRIIR